MRLKFLLPIVILFLTGCQSAKKSNLHNNTKIEIAKLQEDIDYLKKNFLKMHPDTDLYISNDSLNYLFYNAKISIKKPLTPPEFYAHISPVIASIKQGHSRVIYPIIRNTKKETKKYKNTIGPLNQFTYRWANNSLYISGTNVPNKKIALGSEVLLINNIKPIELYEEFIKNNPTDGYNKTNYQHNFNRKFTSLFSQKFGVIDTIVFKLQCEDTIYTAINTRFNTKEKANKTSLNISNEPTKKIKENSKIAKQNFKKIKRQKRILGIVNGYLNRQLLFPIDNDSSFAVLKIRSFNSGKYKKSYDSLFQTIKTKNIKYLVLDLRDNTGGLIADIDDLYSYLKIENEPLLSYSKVNSKTQLPNYFIKGKSTASYVALSSLYPIFYSWVYINTFKDENEVYHYKVAGLKNKKIKENSFKGKLDVLVNGLTFSAASIITSNLQGSKRAKVFGEETGGTFNGTVAGIMPYLKLPNSKLKVRTGLMHIKPYYQTNNKGRGIIPNFQTNLTTDELINKSDVEYEIIYKNKQ